MPELREFQVDTATGNVAIADDTEILALAGGLVTAPGDTEEVTIIAWGQITIGTGGVLLTTRIRRGATVAGTLVGEANGLTVVAANVVGFVVIAKEQRQNVGQLQYCVSVQVGSAVAASTVLQAAIAVFVS